MKAMFYGGAIAAVSGLLMGAGFKTPADAFDVRGAAADMPYIQNADFSEPAPAVQASAAYQPEYLNGVAYAPAAYQTSLADEAAITPAVYTEDVTPPEPASVSYDQDAEAAKPAVNAARSEDASPAEPQPIGQSQGFDMVDAPA
jgi:hypothetical protein